MLGLTEKDLKKDVSIDEEDLALMPGEKEKEKSKPPTPPKYTYLKREDVQIFDKPLRELTNQERLALSW